MSRQMVSGALSSDKYQKRLQFNISLSDRSEIFYDQSVAHRLYFLPQIDSFYFFVHHREHRVSLYSFSVFSSLMHFFSESFQ